MKVKVLKSFVSLKGAFNIGAIVDIDDVGDFVKAGFVVPIDNKSKSTETIHETELSIKDNDTKKKKK